MIKIYGKRPGHCKLVTMTDHLTFIPHFAIYEDHIVLQNVWLTCALKQIAEKAMAVPLDDGVM